MDESKLIPAIAAAAIAIGLIVVRILAQRRLAKMEATRACLACESTNVVEQDGVRTCMSCGYQGRSDGGGKIDAATIDGIYERPRLPSIDRDL